MVYTRMRFKTIFFTLFLIQVVSATPSWNYSEKNRISRSLYLSDNTRDSLINSKKGRSLIKELQKYKKEISSYLDRMNCVSPVANGGCLLGGSNGKVLFYFDGKMSILCELPNAILDFGVLSSQKVILVTGTDYLEFDEESYPKGYSSYEINSLNLSTKELKKITHIKTDSIEWSFVEEKTGKVDSICFFFNQKLLFVKANGNTIRKENKHNVGKVISLRDSYYGVGGNKIFFLNGKQKTLAKYSSIIDVFPNKDRGFCVVSFSEKKGLLISTLDKKRVLFSKRDFLEESVLSVSRDGRFIAISPQPYKTIKVFNMNNQKLFTVALNRDGLLSNFSFTEKGMLVVAVDSIKIDGLKTYSVYDSVISNNSSKSDLPKEQP